MPENLEEKLTTFPSNRSVDSGISVGSNSNVSPTEIGEELLKPKENPPNGIRLLPFSPLKARTVSEVALPMFPNHQSAIRFSPPVRVFRQRHHFECGDKIAELLTQWPDYEQTQPEIVRSIYVAHHIPKRQHQQQTTAKNTG